MKNSFLTKPVKVMVMVEQSDKKVLTDEARRQRISVSALVRKFAQQLREQKAATVA